MPFLKASFRGGLESVDRAAGVIRGYVVAQEGPFKTPGRGEFDKEGLSQIVTLMNKNQLGTKSRFGHPTASDDGLGKFLGRAQNARLSRTTNADGKPVAAVRADLHIDPTSRKTPNGDLGGYVLDLAESDPAGFSSSLVLEPKEVLRLDDKKRPLTDAKGDDLPPLWYPVRIHASDVVDTGDAVDGFLSAEQWCELLGVGITPELEKLLHFDRVARLGTQLLDGQFRGKSRDYVREHAVAWLERYLNLRFGEPAETPLLDAALRRLEQRATSIPR